ncbi:hypothetical protein CC1G_06613 [Coprinopsis cinerea okayama7|uniref:Methyltransferase domain-containing protein n=1 Tax=Coprinopsis cinerea (strain Okayama-7 / 130 / ATCC MYA-4618 / FGSC 9003) TaxID=240176 RepID=A8N2X8_COPC7|nr:hypothetical protein CC1G_06613 [Coprinopsis cinerea okayama7\|eukprot:XP_001829276.2 hypothetical protein CC1G_06613 [Coprinopsis cinerea okayama7\
MAAATVFRPFPPRQDSLSASSQFEAHQHSSFPLQPERPRAVRSHYRPHSTLYLDERPVSHYQQQQRSSVLVKARRQSTLERSASVSIAMGLGVMKRSADKDRAKELTKLRIRKLSEHSGTPPLSPLTPSPTAESTKRVSRPRTAGGETTSSERSSSSGTAALHKVKAQRSMASLFSAAADVSPSMASSDSIPRSKSSAPPSSFRPTKMDVDRLPQTPTTPRSKRSSRVEFDDHQKGKLKKDTTFMDNNVWLSQSNTKVHPYFGEAPYMQAYDTQCLENDRYSELLLQRLSPTSPSFHDYGKKPPLTVLDLGCGQGHWALRAASLWPNSRITGFDIMDITLPTFQTTENLTFVKGNFLFKLPFPAKSFEYVRMSNLSLCIPFNRWMPLLAEIRRVLTNGGRLELIDDQILFPYGEEPKEPSKVESPNKNSFFHWDEGCDSGDDDTLEETTSTSTASTLVSEFDFDKLPSSKRSSTQSNPAVTVVGLEPPTPAYNRDKPLPIPTETLSTQAEDYFSFISPSPTITQDNIDALNGTLAASATFTQEPISDRKGHRKTGSTSSTKSNSEAVTAWKHKKELSLDMEKIFEYLVINKCGIHPRPAEFVQDYLRRTFGKGNAGKIRSFHIKLAPFDSPIGPGGALAPQLPTVEPPMRVDKHLRPRASSDQLKRHWRQISDKKEKKEKERKEKKQEKQQARQRTVSKTSFDDSFQMPLVTAKAASRLGLTPNVPSLPPSNRVSVAYSTSSDSSSGESYSGSYLSSVMPSVSDKAADRLGIPSIPPPVPPKPISSSRSTDMESARPSPSRGLTVPAVPVKAASRLGIPVRPMSRSISAGSSDHGYGISLSSIASSTSLGHTDNPSRSNTSLKASPSPMSRTASSESSSLSLSDPSSPDAPAPGPPSISAKAAGRLGISYSVLAAASAVHSRSSGVMAPVQSPGLLVWPSTYIPMTPTELEMHSCKFVQTLLGCRHALREHITGEFGGVKLATDDDFEEALWEYECFRRSRFHWPNDNPELFADQGFPEPPSPVAQSLPRGVTRQSSGGKSGHSRTDSLDSFNGQYRREELTHIRTIRVFEAVKTVDEKTFMNMLFSGQSSPRKASR